MKNQKHGKREKIDVTPLVLPNYHSNKKDVNEYKNSSHCFPDDFIALAAFSICKENQEGKVKPDPTVYIGERSLPLLFKSINNIKTFEKR